jgi:hypothetical protein
MSLVIYIQKEEIVQHMTALFTCKLLSQKTEFFFLKKNYFVTIKLLTYLAWINDVM